MKGKILLILLNVVLLGALGFFYIQKDQDAPKVMLEETELVYEVGMAENQLMEGVQAFDNQDGDITEYVVIEKIVTDYQKESATITYGVADASGNIGKATRTVKMIVEEEEESTEEATEELLADVANNSEAENEPQSEAEDAIAQNGSNGTGNTGSSTAATDKKPQTNKPATQTNTKPQSNAGAAQTNTKPQNNAGTTSNSNKTNEGAPSLKLRQTSVKTSVGNNPAWVNVIEGCYDDKDDYVTLLGTLQIHGNYDKNTPGTYHVKITVTDTHGNSSAAYPLEIIVE